MKPEVPTISDLQVAQATFSRFMPVDNEMFESMSSYAETLVVPRGTMWVRQDRPSTHVAVIVQGLFRAVYSADGDDVTYGFYYAPGFVTEYAGFVKQGPARFSIEALEDCRIVQWSHAAIQQLYSLGPKGERLGRLIAEEVFVGFMDRTMELLLYSPEERYSRMVARNSTLLQRVPLYMIAEYLGITPESLSRIRARMARKPS
jgi:CRP-like cAMP-binding protein